MQRNVGKRIAGFAFEPKSMFMCVWICSNWGRMENSDAKFVSMLRVVCTAKENITLCFSSHGWLLAAILYIVLYCNGTRVVSVNWELSMFGFVF